MKHKCVWYRRYKPPLNSRKSPTKTDTRQRRYSRQKSWTGTGGMFPATLGPSPSVTHLLWRVQILNNGVYFVFGEVNWESGPSLPSRTLSQWTRCHPLFPLFGPRSVHGPLVRQGKAKRDRRLTQYYYEVLVEDVVRLSDLIYFVNPSWRSRKVGLTMRQHPHRERLLLVSKELTSSWETRCRNLSRVVSGLTPWGVTPEFGSVFPSSVSAWCLPAWGNLQVPPRHMISQTKTETWPFLTNKLLLSVCVWPHVPGTSEWTSDRPARSTTPPRLLRPVLCGDLSRGDTWDRRVVPFCPRETSSSVDPKPKFWNCDGSDL